MQQYKIMRMICMFDLPVDTEEEKRAYRNFRKNLLKEGFVMIQYSIYIRICPNRDFGKRLERRIKQFVPKRGNIRLLMVTEKQYSDMTLLVGCKQLKEEAVGIERMIII